MKRVIKEFTKNNLDFGGTYFFITDKNLFVILNNLFNNIGKFLRQYSSSPALSGDAIIVKKDVFDFLEGFDKSIKFGEDEEFAARAVKKNFKFGLIKYSHKSSGRRIKKIGFHRLIVSFIFNLLFKITKIKKLKNLAYSLYGEIG